MVELRIERIPIYHRVSELANQHFYRAVYSVECTEIIIIIVIL